MKFRKRKAETSIRRQAGAYAMEYALVFPVFFAMLYGTLAYGMIFTMRLSLQHAAEEGVREALRYQAPGGSGLSQITLRETAAESVARTAASWISNVGTLTVVADVCPIAFDCLPNPDATARLADNIVCGEGLTDGCQVIVTVEYPYSTSPIFPSLPGFGVLFPARLQGRARVLLDGRALTL
ncbi:MAG: TadE/TadG family type IV pilus assembly protein [Panacagrimonas sp.]